MPTQRPPTPEEAQYLKSQGIDPEGALINDEPSPQSDASKNGVTSTIAKTALAHLPSYLGGGAGLAAFAAAPFTEGLSLLPAAIGGAASAMGSSYLAQKGAEIAAPETMKSAEESADQAATEHPYIAGATDILGSALAGGGSPSIRNLKLAGEQLIGKNALSEADRLAMAHIGEEALSPEGITQTIAGNEGKEALGKVLGSSLLNPAINTGLDIATGHTPTVGSIASQVAGGALFSEQSRLGAWMTGHGKSTDEPLPETQSKDVSVQPTELESGNSVFNEKDEQGNYTIPDELIKQQYLKENLNTKAEMTKMSREEALRAQAENIALRARTDTDAMRAELHKGANTDSNNSAVDVNKPTDLNKGAVTPSKPTSDQPNTVEANKKKPPVTSANPPTEAELTAKYAAGLSAGTQRLKPGAPAEEDPGSMFYKKPVTPAAVSSPVEVTQNEAAKEANVKSDLAEAVAAHQRAILSGEGTDSITEKLKAAQQRVDDFQKAKAEIAAKQAGTGQPFAENPNIARIVTAKNIQDSMTPKINETPGVDEWLASKKVSTDGKMFDAFQGIPITVWNGSIDAIRLAVRAGKAIHEAIKDGIAHIKANYKGAFDESAYQKEMERQNAPNERSKPEVVRSEREGTDRVRSSTETSSRDSLLSQKEIPRLQAKALGITEPIYDRIAKLAHPSAEKVAGAFKLTDNTKDQYLGESWGKLKTIMDRVGFTKRDGEQLSKIAAYENFTHKPAPLSMFHRVAQKQVYDAERAIYGAVGQRRLANNEPVYRGNGTPTKLIQDPTSHPTPVAQKVIETYKTGTDTKAIKKYDSDFIQNAVKYGKTPEQASKMLSEWKASIQGKMNNPGSNMHFFGGSRLAQGIPLPESFTVSDYASRMETYYKRMALDNAFYKHVESNPAVMSALGETKDAWRKPIPKDDQGGLANNDNVRAALHQFEGESMTTTDRSEGGITNLASTLFVSTPVLEMHKILSNTLNGAIAIADNPVQAAATLGHMITHMSEGLEHSISGGLYKPTARSAADFFQNGATFAERLQALSQGIRNISSLGDRTNKWNSALMQSGFEYAIPNKIALANKGDTTAQMLLHKWDPSYTPGKTYSQEEIQKLASVAAGYVHGTKDGRTMPPWMMRDTELSGFFKLAHWSISQTNRFMSDIYTPATKGNFVPLCNALLGSAVGGYLIRQLREELQGKHGNIPDLKEIASSQGGLQENKGLVAYNLISALQYAGFAGILSQGIKYPVDRMMKNNPQGAVFPLDEIVTDLNKQIGDFISAKANDPNFDWADASVALLNHIMTDNIQLTRIGFNQGVNAGLITGTQADKKLLSDKLGQLRRFDMASNLPYDDQEPAQANAYMNVEQKKFKMNQDIPSAMNELPGLVNNIVQTYGDRPDVMMEKLKALKQNAYDTFPDIKTKAPSLIKYMDYLGKLKGKDEADSEYMDYMHHKLVNEAKSSVVP